jgi:hypothetical protein
MANKVTVRHEGVDWHVYANNPAGNGLLKHLRTQSFGANPSVRHDRRGPIPNRRPISERPSHIDDQRQMAAPKQSHERATKHGSSSFRVELDIKGSSGLARCSWAQPAPAGCLANA